MQITSEYMGQFAVKRVPKPKEIPLYGWEIDANGAITLDDKDGHSIGYLHWDDWPFPQGWLEDGTKNRWTLVRLYDKDSKIVGDHGWEFDGLLEPTMLREWFRAHLGFNE